MLSTSTINEIKKALDSHPVNLFSEDEKIIFELFLMQLNLFKAMDKLAKEIHVDIAFGGGNSINFRIGFISRISEDVDFSIIGENCTKTSQVRALRNVLKHLFKNNPDKRMYLLDKDNVRHYDSKSFGGFKKGVVSDIQYDYESIVTGLIRTLTIDASSVIRDDNKVESAIVRHWKKEEIKCRAIEYIIMDKIIAAWQSKNYGKRNLEHDKFQRHMYDICNVYKNLSAAYKLPWEERMEELEKLQPYHYKKVIAKGYLGIIDEVISISRKKGSPSDTLKRENILLHGADEFTIKETLDILEEIKKEA